MQLLSTYKILRTYGSSVQPDLGTVSKVDGWEWKLPLVEGENLFWRQVTKRMLLKLMQIVEINYLHVYLYTNTYISYIYIYTYIYIPSWERVHILSQKRYFWVDDFPFPKVGYVAWPPSTGHEKLDGWQKLAAEFQETKSSYIYIWIFGVRGPVLLETPRKKSVPNICLLGVRLSWYFCVHMKDCMLWVFPHDIFFGIGDKNQTNIFLCGWSINPAEIRSGPKGLCSIRFVRIWIGIPSYKSLSEPRAIGLFRIGFLFAGFEPDFYYFESLSYISQGQPSSQSVFM